MEQEQWNTQGTWKENLEELKDMISRLCPQWTDYNLHDPGITLAELAAWLGQIQQYQIRQIGREHQKAYLKLFGIRPVKQRPGHTYVTVGAAKPLLVPSGTRFYADHIPFETREEQMASEGIFKGFVMREYAPGRSGQMASRVLEGDWLKEGKGISLQPFGPDCRARSSLTVQLEKPLKPGVNHRLYMEFAGHNGRKPAPVDENAYDGHGYYPLGEIKMEYLSLDGWRLLKGPGGMSGPGKREKGAVGMSGPGKRQEGDCGTSGAGKDHTESDIPGPRDDTHAFIQDGSILFTLDRPMGEGRYCLRFTLVRSDYIIAPCITRISLAMVMVWQQETVDKKELPDFTGTGFPNQSFCLEGGPLDESGFCLEAQSIRADWGRWGKGSVPSAEGCIMEPWTQVEDFHESGPGDRHYRLENETILFGNGIHGMMPEGTIRVRQMVRTLGSGGNIKSGTINRMGYMKEQPEQARISHEMDVTGGTAQESPEQTLSRYRLEQEENWNMPRKRAVTFRDYEQLVLSAPGLMIESCRAYSQRPEQKEITLAVKPCSTHRKAVMSPGYEKNLYRLLEEKRMIGTRLRLVSPDYYDVTIACTVCARVQYRMADQMVAEAVKEWVGARGLGQGIPYGELLGMIDSLPCVQKVESLWLDSASRGKRTPRGDLLVPARGLLNLKRVTCNLMTPMRERL